MQIALQRVFRITFLEHYKAKHPSAFHAAAHQAELLAVNWGNELCALVNQGNYVKVRRHFDALGLAMKLEILRQHAIEIPKGDLGTVLRASLRATKDELMNATASLKTMPSGERKRHFGHI